MELPTLNIVCDEESQKQYSNILERAFNLRYFSDVEEILNPSHRNQIFIFDVDKTTHRQERLIDLLRSGHMPTNRTLIVTDLVTDSSQSQFLMQLARLEVGDILFRPFYDVEMQYRVNRLVSRNSPHSDRCYGLKWDVIKRTVERNGSGSIYLTSMEFQILHSLVNLQKVNKKDAIREIWGNAKPSNKALDVHLSNLRKKLQSLGLTVAWDPSGYFYLNEVQRVSA